MHNKGIAHAPHCHCVPLSLKRNQRTHTTHTHNHFPRRWMNIFLSRAYTFYGISLIHGSRPVSSPHKALLLSRAYLVYSLVVVLESIKFVPSIFNFQFSIISVQTNPSFCAAFVVVSLCDWVEYRRILVSFDWAVLSHRNNINNKRTFDEDIYVFNFHFYRFTDSRINPSVSPSNAFGFSAENRNSEGRH